MRELKRILMAVLMGAVLAVFSLSAFGQRGNNNKNRPPKEPDKVVDKQKPPPSNSNKRGKP